ncbi:hypothetical protein [Mycoplasma sp. 3686d]|uniref:hypothetical protein n=1 Tax=Mycoplasma sp. 3686d TaxID=2967300 RepID=UPI00211BC840|nr:hypothetical protein [Mycoplasma sp. 3686d]UUM24561.1 hypothetical protein NPA12_02565 [Mycoplasma sp. 3686d]
MFVNSNNVIAPNNELIQPIIKDNVIIKNNLAINLNTLLNNSIDLLTKIIPTIRVSPFKDSDTLVDRLQVQINVLQDLKTKYSVDNYTQTFIPVFKDVVESVHQILDEFDENNKDWIMKDWKRKFFELDYWSTSGLLAYANEQPTIQKQLKTLNDETLNNQAQAKKVYESIKTLYTKLINHFYDCYIVYRNDKDVENISKELPEFNDNVSLKNMKWVIETSLNQTNQLFDVFNKKYEDYLISKINNFSDDINNSNNNNLENNVEKFKLFQTFLTNFFNSEFNKYREQYETLEKIALEYQTQGTKWDIDPFNINQINWVIELGDTVNPTKFHILPNWKPFPKPLTLSSFKETTDLNLKRWIIDEYVQRSVLLIFSINGIGYLIVDKLKQQLDLNMQKIKEFKNNIS